MVEWNVSSLALGCVMVKVRRAMEGNELEYMNWSKTHQRVRYELTESGVPHAPATDIAFDPSVPAPLEVRGTYGDPELIAAIAARYHHPEDDVVPVPGASSANFIAVAAAVKPGDRILIEEPVYEPLALIAKFLHLQIQFLARRPEEGFRINLDRLDKDLFQGAKAVVLTNLHNPSAQYISPDEMAAISQRCLEMGAKLIVGEVYLDAVHIVKGTPLWTAAHFGDHVLATNSLTKVYGLSGIRIGWLLTGPELAEQARRIMDLLSVNNAAPSSALAIQAFQNMERLEERYRGLYSAGRPVFADWLEREPRVAGYPNHGAIFECVRLLGGVKAARLCEFLAQEFDTRVTPGDFFQLDDHVRLRTAVPPEDLVEALSRISQALRRVAGE
ncbi:MAG: pyridoxal phosphate-dependent aminotransferase [Planctomycetota bacterium]